MLTDALRVIVNNPFKKSFDEKKKFRIYLVRVFKQQFSVFLEIRVGEKVYENTRNIV